ncbi:MAG: bifunctional nuclease family protein, partial [Propionibacteriales bacterium]|nr:bifunctional nuclease family protein [Propionibacteriales bacterium]
MREVDVVGVRVEMPSNQPIVLLRESSGERYLPIWVGAVEATAIAFAQQGVIPPRPLTHDLLKDVLTATGHELTEVRITEVRDG